MLNVEDERVFRRQNKVSGESPSQTLVLQGLIIEVGLIRFLVIYNQVQTTTLCNRV